LAVINPAAPKGFSNRRPLKNWLRQSKYLKKPWQGGAGVFAGEITAGRGGSIFYFPHCPVAWKTLF
jgi:hypothetical protein